MDIKKNRKKKKERWIGKQNIFFWRENGVNLVAYVWKEGILHQAERKLSTMQYTPFGGNVFKKATIEISSQ